MLNEDALVSALGRLGFSVVRAEELTFGEQVAMFAAAEVVVGAHGGRTDQRPDSPASSPRQTSFSTIFARGRSKATHICSIGSTRELSNAEWESVLPRFRTGPVLFIACALSDRIGVRARLRSHFESRRVLAGYMRNRAALEELLTASHRIASSDDFAGLPGWLLEPAEA